MFEFEDSKLGRVKVVNVTEARANIAAIMSDPEFNYVITKNNKPIRVIINYATYKSSEIPKQSKVISAPKIKQKPQVEIPLASEVEESSLSGLLHTREQELQTNALKPKVKAPKKSLPPVFETPSYREYVKEQHVEPADSFENFEAESVSEPVIEEPKLKTKESEEGSDYFNRFKKLYDNKQTSKPEASTDYFSAPDEVSIPHVEPEIPMMPESEESEFYATQHFESPEKPSSKVLESNPPYNDPPSIDDLLRELEDEKLSGEEEDNLSEDDVKHLLNRISNS